MPLQVGERVCLKENMQPSYGVLYKYVYTTLALVQNNE